MRNPMDAERFPNEDAIERLEAKVEYVPEEIKAILEDHNADLEVLMVELRDEMEGRLEDITIRSTSCGTYSWRYRKSKRP